MPGGRSVIDSSWQILCTICGDRPPRSMDLAWPSLKRSAGIKNGNLLPDLVAQIGGEILDVVDGVDDDRIGQMLRIERGEFVGQREHFAAVIKIASELEPAHRP